MAAAAAAAAAAATATAAATAAQGNDGGPTALAAAAGLTRAPPLLRGLLVHTRQRRAATQRAAAVLAQQAAQGVLAGGAPITPGARADMIATQARALHLPFALAVNRPTRDPPALRVHSHGQPQSQPAFAAATATAPTRAAARSHEKLGAPLELSTHLIAPAAPPAHTGAVAAAVTPLFARAGAGTSAELGLVVGRVGRAGHAGPGGSTVRRGRRPASASAELGSAGSESLSAELARAGAGA